MGQEQGARRARVSDAPHPAHLHSSDAAGSNTFSIADTKGIATAVLAIVPPYRLLILSEMFVGASPGP
jgi:hypothetical protein